MSLEKATDEHRDEYPDRSENKEVVFVTNSPSDNSKRKRYLTAKYDRRTRQKIGEKIRLENFVFEQLRFLYCTQVDDYDCDIDLDEIIALKTNEEKECNLKEKLRSCPAKQEQIDDKFPHTNCKRVSVISRLRPAPQYIMIRILKKIRECYGKRMDV
ncbi:unnamed protein product [Heterobilharzia americana]|nr:unnamed protein product [Heterobilharzia americana]